MSTEDETFEMLKHGECRRCKDIGTELHTCPYHEEINHDYSLCNCCAHCERECSYDI